MLALLRRFRARRKLRKQRHLFNRTMKAGRFLEGALEHDEKTRRSISRINRQVRKIADQQAGEELFCAVSMHFVEEAQSLFRRIYYEKLEEPLEDFDRKFKSG